MEHSAKIIVCCAQKGGVAKTVTTHNLAVALSPVKRFLRLIWTISRI